MSFKDLIYPKNLKYLNENTNLVNSERCYRAFLTSGAFLFFFSIGCGITAQMLSFQRIFYTKDTFFGHADKKLDRIRRDLWSTKS